MHIWLLFGQDTVRTVSTKGEEAAIGFWVPNIFPSLLQFGSVIARNCCLSKKEGISIVRHGGAEHLDELLVLDHPAGGAHVGLAEEL